MITIVQHGVGPALEMHKRYGARTEAWAKRHNCKYVFSDRRIYEDRKPHWEKILLIYELMCASKPDDEILWIDSDTVVVREDVSPYKVLRYNADIAMAADKAETPFNSGVLFIRVNERTKAFFKDVIDRGPMSNIRYHDQSRICERIPYHDIIVQMLPLEWNYAGCTDWARMGCENPIIRAFHGWPRDKALDGMGIYFGELNEELPKDNTPKPAAFPAFIYADIDEFGFFVDFEKNASYVEIENLGENIVYIKPMAMPDFGFRTGQTHLHPGKTLILDSFSIPRIGFVTEPNKKTKVHVQGLRG